jgi:hypothetical protein
MDSQQALKLLKGIQSEIEFSPGNARTDDFGGLRVVDAKAKRNQNDFKWCQWFA